MAGALGGMTAVVKAGLVEPNPEANKALWMESGSILLFFFFFLFSFPFFGSFRMSHGSKTRGGHKGLPWAPSQINKKVSVKLPFEVSPSSPSSSDSSLNGLKSSSSSPELTDLKLSSLSLLDSSSDSDWLSSELVPDRPPCLRGFFFCCCFFTSEPGDMISNGWKHVNKTFVKCAHIFTKH